MDQILTVRKARTEEAATAKEIIQQTAEWFAEQGSNQWSDIRKGKDTQDLNEAAKNEEVYLSFYGDEPVGMFMLRDKQNEWDEMCWGTDDGEFYYLHIINIMRKHSGEGLGSRLLKEALNITLKDGKEAVRLDCDANNDKLNNFYEKNGFTKVKEKYTRGYGEEEIDYFSLFEKEV